AQALGQLRVILGGQETDMPPVSREQLIAADPGERDLVATADYLREQPSRYGRVIRVRLVECSDDRFDDFRDIGLDVDHGDLRARASRERARQIGLVGRVRT